MDNYITKFALSCLTINCILIKMFTNLPMSLAYDAGSGAVTALWLSTVIGILIISLVYIFKNQITSWLTHRSTIKIFSCIVFAYFVCLDIYFLYTTVNTIHSTIYHNMPILMIFTVIIIAMLYIGTRSVYSITRLHSICVPIIILGIIAVALSGLKYTEAYNAVPILGNGIASIFSSGLKHLFAFSEITIPVLTIILSSNQTRIQSKQSFSNNYKSSKVILISSIIGILIYSAVLTVFFLTMPSSAYSEAGLPLYYLSKFSAAGRLNVRTDALYTLVLTASAVLFTGSTLYIIITALKKIGFTKKIYSRYTTGVFAAVIFAAITLCGCYDAREVEDTAFVIAIGADVNNQSDKHFNFTFQFTNPLATGQNTNIDSSKSKSSENEASGGENSESESNTTVDNIKVEADSFFEAMNMVTNHMGKSPSLAHIKLLVLSEDVAFSEQSEAINSICSDILKADEIRPETSVCIAKGFTALEYLTSVNPSLEESTARHYELMFDKSSTFDSVQTDLRTFTSKLQNDNSSNAYAPFVTKDGFDGTVLFAGNKAVAAIDSENSRLMNIILGNVKKTNLFYTDTANHIYRLKQSSHPKIKINIQNGYTNDSIISGVIKLSIDAEPIDTNSYSDSDALSDEINSKINKLLSFIYSNNSDVFGIGKSAKAAMKYEWEWQSLKQYVPVSSYNIKSDIAVNLIK